ncbi:MAG: ATP-dependent sacrificial sulfur transferase LarE [Clostridia bacterium]|nr:ATP-dependent sacrificial sulfur transferase LarE [Clostridia bacterium]MBQ3611106.1 ATP-dependent sacrificial sulfur transferase LarE [Bacillota bacterium]
MKLDKLEKILKSYKRITVALSGGVDSAFLLAFASKALGAENVRAITACGPHLAEDEVEYAKALCASLGIEHDVISMDYIMPILAPNPADRCYHCKKAMFSTLKEFAAKAAADDFVLADGTNLDDMDDYRPGHKALAELDIASPLKDAGLTKNEIRTALEMLSKEDRLLANSLMLHDGTPIWDKPAFACLASRIPYGEEITEDKLAAVYKAETFLRSLGLRQVRVRHHGDIARIEVPAEDRVKLFGGQLDGKFDETLETTLDKINEEIKKYGFKYVTLDLGGYKMGGGFHNGQENK